MLAFTVNDPDGKVRIHLRSIDRVETRVLPGTEGAAHPFWAPDSRLLAFVGGNQPPFFLKRIDVVSGAARDLSEANGPWHGTLNQNGDILFLNLGLTMRIPAEGGGSKSATPVPGGGGFPYFLQDGKRFLVSVLTANGQRSIQLAMLGSEKRTMVIDNVDTAPILAPTPQGKVYLLHLRESDLYAQEFDERSGKLRGNPMLVVSNIGRVASLLEMPAVGVSRSGILAYQTDRYFNRNMGQLVWVDRSGKPVDSLPANASGRNPELSPDGLSVAVGRTNASGVESVWITDLVRKSSHQLTFGAGTVSDVNPVWSPDSRHIAFLRIRGGKDGGVHIVDTKDNSKDQRVHEEFYTVQSWSPDGKYLLVVSRDRRLSLLPLAGDQKPIPVGSPNGRSLGGRISPDGKSIAFVSNEEGQNEIYVQPMPPSTGPIKVSNGGGIYPRWSKDSKELFFLSRGTFTAVDIRADGTFSAPHPLFEIKVAVSADVAVADYDVRGDGKQFLIYMVPKAPQDAPITVVLNWWADLRQQP
jgi:Tol biopolymer transport system component